MPAEDPKPMPVESGPIRQFVRIVSAAGAFLAFGLGGWLLSWLVLPLVWIAGGPLPRRRRRCMRVVQGSFIFFHAYMRRVGLLDYAPARHRQPLPAGGVVIVANHPTLVDVTALISTFGELIVVARPGLFRNPLIGPLLRLCGHIDSGSSSLEDGIPVVKLGLERLADGHAILIFPEGTRSPREGLRRFHNGAFRLAHEANATVLPIRMWADPPALMKGQPWYDLPRAPIRLSLRPLTPVRAQAYADARKLQTAVRVAIVEAA